MPPIQIVQGGSYGSEAKGAIAAFMCEKDNIDYCVRTGATNAGHTVFYKSKPYKMQQIGVGWVNPNTRLVIGAGALIDPKILIREIAMINEATGEDVRKRLFVDRRCGMHFPYHANASSVSGRHHKIGATGKGCSEALIDRIKARGQNYMLFDQWNTRLGKIDVVTTDTENMLNSAYDGGASILLEGTQGQLLDLYFGPYPYTTHKQTGPAQWLLECGLSPSLPNEITMVVRTFPIRVAGNSGPLKNEISWPILAGEINAKRSAKGLLPIVREDSVLAFQESLRVVAKDFALPVGAGDGSDQHLWSVGDRNTYQEAASELNASAWKLLPEAVQADLLNLFELTTVTKKLRRIARFDTLDFQVALRQVRPKYIALTFANYLQPDIWYNKPDVVKSSMIGVPCHLVSYGPESKHVVDLR